MHRGRSERRRGTFRSDLVPREDSGEEPREQAYQRGPGLRAHVPRLQGFADGVVSLEADRQDGQDRGVRHGHLHERHRLTWNRRKE